MTAPLKAAIYRLYALATEIADVGAPEKHWVNTTKKKNGRIIQ